MVKIPTFCNYWFSFLTPVSMTPDYCLRLRLEQLNGLPFEHLESGIDTVDEEDAPLCPAEGACSAAPIAGYTEWISLLAPAHSIGWDWIAQGSAGLLALRAHSIRTNIMLVDAQGRDAGRLQTEEAIGVLIAGWDWPATVLEAIKRAPSGASAGAPPQHLPS